MMTNSIKYILVKRNKRQKDLTTSDFQKQYVSKAINGEFRLCDELIQIITKETGVPAKFFVDEESGKCKQLSSSDLIELEEFLSTPALIELEEELQPMVEIPMRERQLTIDIRKLQRKIRNDILSVKEEVDSHYVALDVQENNLYFYRKMLEIRHSLLVTNHEWDSIFKAFYYLMDNPPEEDIEDSSSLSYKLYKAIKEDRALNESQQRQYLKDFEEIYGSIETISENSNC